MKKVLVNRGFGIVFTLMLMSGVYLTYAVFTKKFVDVVSVDVNTSRVGLQLPTHADVKIRGVIVGEVRSAETSGEGATLHLALNPDDVDLIPSDVSANIIPKTLFGEKYVELVIPESPSPVSIAAGDVIEQTAVSIEVSKVLADSYPLIVAVQPAELSYTLNALSTALEGRGGELGDNLVLLDSYLKQLNPLMPAVIDDLTQLKKVANLYEEVLPDLALTLDHTVLTGNTIVEKREELQTFLTSVTGLSDTLRDFLIANGDGLIRLSEVSRPTLEVLAKYSPEFPCLTQGLVNWIPRMASAYRGYVFHINLETVKKQPNGYTSADSPIFGATNGAHCETLPNPPYSQDNPGPQPGPGEVVDGYQDSGHMKRPAQGRR